MSSSSATGVPKAVLVTTCKVAAPRQRPLPLGDEDPSADRVGQQRFKAAALRGWRSAELVLLLEEHPQQPHKLLDVAGTSRPDPHLARRHRHPVSDGNPAVRQPGTGYPCPCHRHTVG